MKTTIKVQKEVEIKELHVKAEVRYWEDSYINGEPAMENGDDTPCKSGEMWQPVIDVNTGKIAFWPQGTTADIHYKVCDAGSYYLVDAEGNKIPSLSIEQDYVPKCMCPKENGYGDYIIMDIDGNGQIKDWKFSLDGFENEDD